MDYKTVDSLHYTPKTVWLEGKIPDLPCIRNAERKAAIANGAGNGSEEEVDDWRFVILTVAGALRDFPEARKAVQEAIDRYRVTLPRDA